MARAVFALVVAAVLLGGGACKGCREEPSTSVSSTPASKAHPDKAVVEGVVRLADGASLPSYQPEQMEKKLLKQLARAALPDICTPPKTTDRQPVQLTADGLLSGVMLAASNFSHQPQRPAVAHEVTIKDCRLEPALVVAMKGDSLRVRSTVNYPFMPSYDEGSAVRSLIPGQTYDVTLDKPGVAPLLCGFTAPCGRTDVVVMLHPVYAVTDAGGRFRFEDFPTGEAVTLSAWHPLFEEAKLQVRVEPGEHQHVELVLKPLATATAAPAAAQAPEPAPTKAPR